MRPLIARSTTGGVLAIAAFFLLAGSAAAQSSPTLVIEASAVGGGGTFSFVVSCATPSDASGGVATSSSTVERPTLSVGAGTTGRLELTPADGASCTVLEQNAGGGSLAATGGGAHVLDVKGAPLGETVGIRAGSTATLNFSNNFVQVQDARVSRTSAGAAPSAANRANTLPRTGGADRGLAAIAVAIMAFGAGLIAATRQRVSDRKRRRAA